MRLPETATLAQARALLEEFDAALAQAHGGAELGIDATALKSFDSSAVALLLHAQRAGKAAGVRIGVHGTPPKLRELARLYGVEDLLALH